MQIKNHPLTAARLTAFVLTLCLALSFCTFSESAAVPVYADAISDKQKEINAIDKKLADLQKQKKENSGNISETKNDMYAVGQEINYKQQQIDLMIEKIDLENDEIERLDGEIEKLGIEIDGLTRDYNENYALYQTRMRANYKADHSTILDCLLGASTFSEFLTRSDTLRRIAEHDQKLLDDLEQNRIEVETEKANQETLRTKADERRAENIQTKADLEKKKAALGGQYSDLSDNLDYYNSLNAKYSKEIKEFQAEKAQQEKDLKKLYDELAAQNNKYVGGEFMWPLPGYSKITSGYGQRTVYGVPDFHRGIDISGANVYGKPIVAANAGKVVLAMPTYTPNKGYGKYIIIDHGGGKSTLYGHCSQLYVKVGDTVTKGQKIAAVGSTGRSTGPHLHFEVRINGKHTNPGPYVGLK